MKGENNGILDNISSVFSKMLNDLEGWFLNYVENDQRAPNEKYLSNIVTKMYKNEEKAEKLSSIIKKFVMGNSSKTKSIEKAL
jgi:hypothetical protein